MISLDSYINERWAKHWWGPITWANSAITAGRNSISLNWSQYGAKAIKVFNITWLTGAAAVSHFTDNANPNAPLFTIAGGFPLPVFQTNTSFVYLFESATPTLFCTDNTVLFSIGYQYLKIKP